MASKIDKDDLITCPICFEHFTSPKSLPCFHTFCYECLRSYIISHLGGKGQKARPFPCPVCRQEVPVPDPSLPLEKVAETMPGNHFITSLIDRELASREGHSERLCDPCNYDNQKIPAVTWCAVCLEGMCESCTVSHRRIKSSRLHKTLPIADVPETQREMLEIDVPCLKHAGKVLEVYCSDHKEMCCVLCLATNHRQCEHISTLEEMVSGSENLESVNDFTSYLKQIEEKTEKVKTITDNNIKSLDNRQDEISKKVSDAVQKAKDRLDQLQSNFMTNLKQTHKGQRTKLTERKEQVEIFQNCVKKADKLLDAVKQQGSPRQLFVTKEKIKMQLQNQLSSLREDLQDVDHFDYGLKIAEPITIVNESLTTLAEVEVTKTKDELRDNVEGILVKMDRLCNREPIAKTVDISKINATQVSKIGSWEHTGGTFLSDGRLVLCSSNKLQVYQTTGRKLFEVRLNDNPFDACNVSPMEVIVSLYNSKCLQKYEVTQDRFIHKETFKCKDNPYGVVATKDNIFVRYFNTVDMLTMDGKFIRTIQLSIKDLIYFGQRYYVSLSTCGSILYNDYDDVISVTLDGKKVSRFNSPEVKCVHGIAIDKYGNIYACGYNSRNVCFFSSDGKTHTTLIENIVRPLGIGFNREGTQLFITSYNGVYIYDIHYN